MKLEKPLISSKKCEKCSTGFGKNNRHKNSSAVLSGRTPSFESTVTVHQHLGYVGLRGSQEIAKSIHALHQLGAFRSIIFLERSFIWNEVCMSLPELSVNERTLSASPARATNKKQLMRSNV